MDQAAKEGKKVCYWSDVPGKRVVCDSKNSTGACKGNQCSNANTNLARYAMCTNSPVCGSKTVFVNVPVDISANFTNSDQICVYTIIFHEFDPLNVIPDVSLNANSLKNVQAELFSKVE